MNEEKFGHDYFESGLATGQSNYDRYRWLPDATLSLADHLKRYLGIREGESLFEFGAAKGFCVKALRMRGVDARGYDISEYAVQNCDPAVKDHLSTTLTIGDGWDYLYLKDTGEHVPEEDLCLLLPKLLAATRKKALIIVPLAEVTDGKYINPIDELDATHIHRWTLKDWILFLQKRSSDFVVSGSFRIPNIKPTSEIYPCSCGFFTLQRF